MDDIKDFVHRITASFVDFPDAIDVEIINGKNTSVVELRVDQTDIGKVIGRQGQTVSALRTLLTAVSSKHKKRTVLEIVE